MSARASGRAGGREREIERDGWRREREGWRTERESLERGKRVLQQRVADLLEVLLLQRLLLHVQHDDDCY